MKYRLLFALLAVFMIASSLHAQNTSKKEKPVLVPYRKGNLWGFANEKKRIVIQPQFEKAGFFKNNNNLYYAEGKMNGKPVLITEDGKYIADEFSDGTTLIEFGSFVQYYQNDMADASMIVDGKHGFRLRGGTFVHSSMYDQASVFLKNESLGVIRMRSSKRFGVIDTLGNVRIPFEYDQIITLNDESLIFAGKVGRKWRIIDATNTRLHPDDFDEIYEGSSDRVRARKNGKYGYLDSNGKEVIPFKYDTARNFGDDPAILNFALVGYTGFEFFIDTKGNEFMER